MLWHGSNTYIEGQLIPHKSFHYEPLVYATTDSIYALIRAGKFDINNLALKEDYDGFVHTLIELKENAIEEVFDTDGYMYVVNEKSFYRTKECMPNEFVSKEPCNIEHTLHIKNILDDIKHCYPYIKIIRYGSKEEKEYWETVRGGREGYLQRRKERIERLKTDK